MKILTTIVMLITIGITQIQADDNFKIEDAQVKYIQELDLLVFSQTLKAKAGKTTPVKNGALHGAPVLGYVFPTSLKSTDVGFNETEGIVALALTSHPDFDDTPLWDENNDKEYANDGIVWHPHWVILVKDPRVKGGLSVKEFDPQKDKVTLPPTNPGMPMFMDSPGFSVVIQDDTIKVLVPANRVNNKIDFNWDGVSVFMKVDTEGKMPMLGVYEVYSVYKGKLDIKNSVKMQ